MKIVHKLSVLIAFIFIGLNLFADDSLQSLYNTNRLALRTTDTAQIVESYKFLGDYLCETGDYEKSNLYLEKGLELALQHKLMREVGVISNLLATNASYVGDRALALNYYHKALKAFADIKDLDKVAMTLMNMGSEYEYMGNYKYAIAYTLKAIKNKESSGVKKNMAYYYQHLGQLFKETDLKKWKFYVDKAYEIAQNSTEERISTRVAIFNDLGGIAQKEKKYEEAYNWYDSMIVVSKAAEYKNGLATAYSNRSHVYKLEKKFDYALVDVLKALDIAYEMNRNYSIIVGHTDAANILIDMNKAGKAQYHATKALELAQSFKTYPEEEAAAHLALAVVGEKTHNWEMAYTHYCSYNEGMDSIRDVNVQKSMHDLEVKYQTSEKEREIARLDSENRLKSITISRNKTLIISILVIVVLLVGLMFLLYVRNRLRNAKQQAELKQKLLRSQMNPHFMFNTLNAINQYIQTNKGNEASDYLARYAKLMRQILENSAVEYVSLETEIEFISNYLLMQQLRFDSSFKYFVVTDPEIDPALYEIPPMIAQPFIENAIEHGIRGITGGIVRVQFKFENNRLILSVADNGKGFQSTSKDINHRSFALDITRERLNINGSKTEKIKIASPDPESGNGTLVVIEIPFKYLDEK